MALTTKELLSADERRRLASLLVPGLSFSQHSLTGGDRVRFYLNLDKVLTDPNGSTELVSMLEKSIKGIAEERKIDRLGFIDNSARGPSALLGCQVALEAATGLPSIIVRPDKRLHVSQVTGEFEVGNHVLFVCDVLTTGQTLARAAAICARQQLSVVGAVFVMDRMCHGQEDLAKVGIYTKPMTDLDHLRKDAREELTPEEVSAMEPVPTSEHHDLFRPMAMQM